MIENDRKIVENLLDKALNQQSELFKLQFQNLFDKLDSIHSEVKKTNGTVREHTSLIQQLKESEVKHAVNCPQKKEIGEIKTKVSNIEMIEVSRNAVSKFTWKQLTAIGIIVGIVFTILNFIFNK